ncbi:MAG TPA: sigma-54 dependent transcriptional regulator [Blastocatellia bacterium]|nr:sigma-54 dependent transcriptional regulator [Blastocatellia bacterium]
MSNQSVEILIVDDDPVTCDLLSEVFQQEGYSPTTARSGPEAISLTESQRFDIVLSDIRMQTKIDGLDVLKAIKQQNENTKVILMTAFGSLETAIEAVRQGAFDYISKPFDLDAVTLAVRRALQQQPHDEAHNDLQEEPPDSLEQRSIIGRNPAMLEVYKLIAHVADTRTAVLISGESGTGKELVARAIHLNSSRSDKPFIAINCGALAETLLDSELFGHERGSFTGAIATKKGIFENATGGTVFLDEVSEMSPSLQVKLLRVLQEQEVTRVGTSSPVRVDVRIISASNRDLKEMVAQSQFREDLLYRLNVINIKLPPLRERRDDIPLLVAHFLRKYTRAGQQCTISADVMTKLKSYDWPGNIRELENTIERAVALSRTGMIGARDLAINVSSDAPAQDTEDKIESLFDGLPTFDELERRYLLHVLKVTASNRTQAADILGINRKTLYRMAERFGIEL